MARTIFLHIGIEKTGTTTLQAVGRVNRDVLRARGLLYPRSPGEGNHLRLAIHAAEFGPANDVRRSAGLAPDEAFQEFLRDFPDQLAREIEDSGCERVWFSNEHLSSRVRTPPQIERVADLMHRLADDVRVIVYLRDQPELFLSAYSTAIRSGNDRDMAPPLKGTEYFYNFEMLLNRWSRAFGRSALIVRIFDRDTLARGDIVADMFDILGVTLDEGIVLPKGLNRSLDANALQFLRLFNRHVPWLIANGVNPEHGDVGSLLEGLDTGPKLAADGDMMRAIASAFAEVNQRVAQRFLGRADGRLFAPRDYPTEGTLRPLSVDTARMIASRLQTAKQDQLDQLERRAKTASLAIPPRLLDGHAELLTPTTADGVVEAASRVWREQQRRLLLLRDMLQRKRSMRRLTA